MKKKFFLGAFACSALWLGAQHMTRLYADRLSTVTTTSTSTGCCVTRTPLQKTVTAGTFQTVAPPGIDFDPSPTATFFLQSSATPGSSEMYITEISDGNALMWARRVDGNGEEVPTAIVSNSTAVYVTGYFTKSANFSSTTTLTSTLDASGASTRDIFIARYDHSGNLIWAKRIGGPFDDMATNISFDAAGNLLICGNFGGSVCFDPINPPMAATTLTSSVGDKDAFFARYNTGCALNMIKKIGGVGDDIANSVVADASGALVVAGSYGNINCDFNPNPSPFAVVTASSHLGSTDAFVCRYTSAGGIIPGWPFCFGATSSDEVKEVITDAANNIYFAGNFSQGIMNFTTTLPTSVTTLTNGATVPDIRNIVLGRLTSTKTLTWIQGFGDLQDDLVNGIALDNATPNNVYITGYYQGTCDFDFFGSSPLWTSTSRNIYVARYNTTNGTYVDVDEITGTGADRATDIAIDIGTQRLALSGDFSPPGANFETGSVTSFWVNSVSSSGTDAFVAVYDYLLVTPKANGGGFSFNNGNESERKRDDSRFQIYPNPTSGIFFMGALEEGTVVEVFSIRGEKTGSWLVAGGSNSMIDITNLSDGIYLLRMVSPGGEIRSEKLVLQR